MANDPFLLKMFAMGDALITHIDSMRHFVKQGDSFETMMNQPKILELRQLLSFDDDYYRQVYEKELIYLWAFQGEITIDTCIELVKSLPENADESSTYKILGETTDDTGKTLLSPVLKAMESFVHEKYLSIYCILKGGGHRNNYGETPKTRLLNALTELKTQWENKSIVTEPWDEKYLNAKEYSC